ncbi:MAG: homoserine O-acetyltransferase [Candidatus Omnitrophica bacterium]|jgi:homoserine O-acetyltransferase|nr:homoserine O-acetyltransferase [Candidatus Omnitrophota bacterium]MDD5661150.1 homoserine O-acetyltransferase [Candidatus Omnitrophota bacterium]
MNKDKVIKNDGVGKVRSQVFTFDSLKLENAEKLGPVSLAYETYGSLNKDKSNAILIAHALSGDAHAAGVHEGEDNPGWWDEFIGPGRAFDTDRYFVICSNVLGGCKGSTGPASLNPKTSKPFALEFPLITINDIVAAQKRLIDHLGIEKLLSVVGGSMGGQQVLAWLVKYPQSLCSAVPIATTIKHSPQQIAFNEVGRQAIMADAHWKSGNYYEGLPPSKGLAVARMIGHITYMSDKSMAEKFGRAKKGIGEPFKFTADFEVEGYLRYRGDNFVKRFDANSYLYITKAMDNFDASGGKRFEEVLRGTKAKVLVISFKSDWLYPAYQSKEIVKACKLAGVETTYCEIDSTYGHDAFLLEVAEESHLIRHFLKKVFYAYEVTGEYGA